MPNRIAIVGEAWGAEEAIFEEAFVGKAGRFLRKLLTSVGVDPEDTYFTNVFDFRPGENSNDLELLCCLKRDLPNDYPSLPSLTKGFYLKPEHLPWLDYLYEKLAQAQPNVVIALGNTALWALTGKSPKITASRGSVFMDKTDRYKCIASFHPAKVLRDYKDKTVLMADLMKAQRESHYPEIRLPKRKIMVAESLEDLKQFEEFIYAESPNPMAFDIETKAQKFITSISFSRSPDWSLVVPLRRESLEDYWDKPTEVQVVRWLKTVLEEREIPKLAQNGLYDIQWLWRVLKIQVRNYSHDTMLLHHALWPELPKGLGFMGTVHTNEANWKLYKPKHLSDNKREDE